jgi:hypothetical protein
LLVVADLLLRFVPAPQSASRPLSTACGSADAGRQLGHLILNIADGFSPDLGRSRDGLYEQTLADSEREAVADLLQYLENVRLLHLLLHSCPDTQQHLQRAETDFFTGDPLRALATLVYSDNLDLQRSASLTFAEITERDVREVDRDTLEPILFLLQNNDIEVQRAASAALGNLAVNSTLPLEASAIATNQSSQRRTRSRSWLWAASDH